MIDKMRIFLLGSSDLLADKNPLLGKESHNFIAIKILTFSSFRHLLGWPEIAIWEVVVKVGPLFEHRVLELLNLDEAHMTSSPTTKNKVVQ